MLPQILEKDRFDALVGYLLEDRRLVAPVAKGPQFAFAEIEGPEDAGRIRMDYDITILPPKKYLYPQHETLVKFGSADPADFEATAKVLPTVILGVHPYDLHGLTTLERVFSMEPSDPYVGERRKAMTLIGLNIQKGYVDDQQFMADMGTLEPPEGGFDLFLTDLGDRYYVEVGSREGERIVEGSRQFVQARPEDHKAHQDYEKTKLANYSKRLPYNTRYLPELLNSSYDSLLWDAVARRCFSCGTCTNVCPTCYCFDVQDKLDLSGGGTRERTWDSCQLRVFAEVAGGENFREHRASRVRHRMFRKGKYILERSGKTGCVGCGRCTRHCVASISILEAFQQIAGEAAEMGS